MSPKKCNTYDHFIDFCKGQLVLLVDSYKHFALFADELLDFGSSTKAI